MAAAKSLQLPISVFWDPKDNGIYMGIDGDSPEFDEWGNRVSFFAHIVKDGSRLDRYLFRKFFYGLAKKRPEMWDANPDIPRVNPTAACPAAGCDVRGTIPGIRRHMKAMHPELHGKVKVQLG
jgi:hypothetical protein